MATNSVSSGKNLTVTAPAALSSGDGFVIGDLFMVAQADALSGAEVVGDTQGIYDLPANSGDTFAAGDTVFWDVSANECVDTAVTGDQQIGVALGAADGNDILRVRLDGVGQTITP